MYIPWTNEASDSLMFSPHFTGDPVKKGGIYFSMS